MMEHIRAVLDDPAHRDYVSDERKRLIQDKIDVNAWILNLILGS
jgi:hypothetical protein